MTHNFEIVKTAQVKQGELAKLVRVSRVTVNGWMSGRHAPHDLLADRVQRVLDLLTLAVKAGDLPLHPTLRGAERIIQLKTIMAKLLSAAKR